jgi:hypothetical protein
MIERFRMGLKPHSYLYFTNPFTKVNGNYSSIGISLLPSALADELVNDNKSNSALYLLPSALADGLAKLLHKLALATFLIVALLMLTSFQTSEIEKKEKELPEVIYPRYRIWTTPSAGEEPAFNSPSFEWPSKKKSKYSVRLSSSKDFSTDLIERDEIPYAIFNPHKILDEGKWFWQYKTEGGKWNEIDSFLITSSTPKFRTPEIKKVLQAIPC